MPGKQKDHTHRCLSLGKYFADSSFQPARKACLPEHFRLHPAHHAQVKNKEQSVNHKAHRSGRHDNAVNCPLIAVYFCDQYHKFNHYKNKRSH